MIQYVEKNYHTKSLSIEMENLTFSVSIQTENHKGRMIAKS